MTPRSGADRRTATAPEPSQPEPSQRSRTSVAEEPPQTQARTAPPAAGNPPGTRVGDPGPGSGMQLRHRVGDDGERSELALQTDNPGTHNQIAAILQRWANTLVVGDLDAHMELYAEILDVYNGRSRVSKSAVRAEKEQSLSGKGRVQKIEMSDLRINEADNRNSVTVSFTKYTQPTAVDGSPASIRQRLVFSRIAGEWKIIGEEQLPEHSRR